MRLAAEDGIEVAASVGQMTGYPPIGGIIENTNFPPIGGKFRSLAIAVVCRKSRFQAGNCVSILFGGQVFEFQPGVRILERNAYHVVDQYRDLVTLRRLQFSRQT